MSSIGQNLLSTSKQLQQQPFLDISLPFNRGSYRSSQYIQDILLLCNFPDVLDVSLTQIRFLFLLKQTLNTGGDNLSLEYAISNPILGLTSTAKDTINLDPVTRFSLVNKIVLQDDLNAPGQLARRRILWHLLYSDNLAVLVNTVAILGRERVLIFILDRELNIAIILARDVFGHLRQIGIIRVVLDQAFLRLLAVVHAGLDLWLDNCHPGDDSLH